jgi:hypothetical protein
MFTGGLAGGGGTRHRLDHGAWLQRLHDVRGCVVPVVGAPRGAVRIFTSVHVCMSVCLRAHARARVCFNVYVRSNGKLRLHDVARDAEGLHDKHSILDPRSITVTENMHIGNALAKDGRLYACFHPRLTCGRRAKELREICRTQAGDGI